MKGSRHSLLGSLLLSFCLPAAALDAEVSGMEGAAADNIVDYLAGFDASQYGRQRLEAEVLRRSQEALKAFGYYEPRLSVELRGSPVEEALIQVGPGARVMVDQIDVQVVGDAQDDETFQAALDDFDLSVGEPLRHAPYDGLRNQLSSLSLERGYFDADFTQRRIEVRPWEQSARINLRLESGKRYRFGEIRYQGSHIEEQRLHKLLPFSAGDPYLAGQLGEYSQRLGETGWFRGISVRPHIVGASSPPILAHRSWWEAVEHEPATPRPALLSATAINAATRLGKPPSPEVPIDVNVTPADRHQFEVGIGYATDVGPRTQFSWEQPWLNANGDSLEHRLFLSAPEQEFIGEYRMPLENPLRDRYELLYGLKSLDNEDTQSLETSVELARRWRFENDWIQRLYFRTTYEDYKQADQEDQVLLLYPGISWSRTRTRNPRFPSWGDRQLLTLEISDDVWGSDAAFVRTTMETQWIRMLGSNTRFVGRTGIGAMSTDDFDKIPPSLRFFAGGDRSVRGYSYESLAPENEEGELLGGQHLFTASLEMQQRLRGDWWGAAFVDTGNAFNAWWPEDLATGAGLGVRWISPVGPVRFDVAHPFDDEEDSWRLHFAIGPEF